MEKGKKKEVTRFLKALLMSLMLALIIPSVIPGQMAAVQAATVKINKTSATLIKGQTLKLKISGTSSTVTWSSSKTSVAKVSSSGKVTAKKKGTATITATVDGVKYTCKIKVEAPKISTTSVTIAKGKTTTLKLSGTTQEVTWASEDKTIATVSSAGKVKGKKVGTTTITATVGGKEYTCTVTVQNPSISKTSLTMETDTSTTLKVSGTDQTVTWKSSNTSIATVSSKGVVKAKNAGTATISATVLGKTLKCTVTVESAELFDPQTAVSKLSYTSYRCDDGVIVIVKNNYKYGIRLEMDCLFYDESGTLISKTSDNNYALEAGAECALFCNNPYDANYRDVDYTSYKLSFTASDLSSYIVTNASKIQTSANFGADNVMVTVKNNGVNVSYTSVAVVFYKDGAPIGYSDHYVDVDEAGSVDYVKYSFPYDSNYKTIYPDAYKVYVNYSYTYSWKS